MDFIFDPSLVLYLPLYKLDGASFMSKDKHGHPCTVTGALWRPNGRKFDGDDLINIDAAVIPLASTTVGTWLAWVKPDLSLPASSEQIISFGDTDASTYLFFYHITSGKLRGVAALVGVNKWLVDTTNVVFSDATWAMVGLVQDGVSPVLYVNGVAVAQSFNVSTDKTIWFNDLGGLDNGRIGCYSVNSGGNTGFYNGTKGEVLLYNRALTPLEIQHNYLATKWRYK